MASINRVVLDILKPHQPNAVDFALALASHASGCKVSVTVTAVDEKTENLEVTVDGEAIDFERLRSAINDIGGSIHSIDAVDVTAPAAPATE